MIIDLNCCIACKACIVACSQANRIPEGMWRKLKVVENPLPPGRRRFSATRSCMHCEEPPCKSVCPTKATFQRSDGIVGIDQGKCIGCGYCILACPYDARTIYRKRHSFEFNNTSDNMNTDQENWERKGVCTKCNFCVSRIEMGLKQNLKPGVDPDATPLCVVTCSCGALHFGDLDDPLCNISQLLKNRKTFRLFTGVETGPSVYYLED